MTCISPKKFRKRQVLAAIEDDCGVQQLLTAADGKASVEVSPAFNIETDMNERNIARATLTQVQSVAGACRGSSTLSSAIRGSGDRTIPPEHDVLLIGCSMQRIDLRYFVISSLSGLFVANEVLTGGTSAATGRFVLSQNVVGVQELFLEVLTGTFQAAEEITGGTSAATADIDDAGTVGGFQYLPVSENQKTLTIRHEEDGLKKEMKGVMGSWSMAAESSTFGKYEFSFQGVIPHIDDEVLPVGTITGTFVVGETVTGGTSSANGTVLRANISGTDGEVLIKLISGTFTSGETITGGTSAATATTTATAINAGMDDFPFTSGVTRFKVDPPILQDAGLLLDDFSPIFQSVSMDMANEVALRENANSDTGYETADIGGRKPASGLNPEVMLVSENDIYRKWKANDVTTLRFRLDRGPGNTVYFFATQAQYQNITDGDRNGNTIYDIEIMLNGAEDQAGDDELSIVYV